MIGKHCKYRIYKNLLNQIQEKQRLLNDEEIFNFYAENIQRNFCKWTTVKKIETIEGIQRYGHYDAFNNADMTRKAELFYIKALGVLVSSGMLKIEIPPIVSGKYLCSTEMLDIANTPIEK